MPLRRMPHAVFQGKDQNLVEIGVRQLDLAAKDRNQMLAFELLWIYVGPVALEAYPVGRIRPKQVFIRTAMRLMAGSATLLKRGLVENWLLG